MWKIESASKSKLGISLHTHIVIIFTEIQAFTIIIRTRMFLQAAAIVIKLFNANIDGGCVERRELDCSCHLLLSYIYIAWVIWSPLNLNSTTRKTFSFGPALLFPTSEKQSYSVSQSNHNAPQ